MTENHLMKYLGVPILDNKGNFRRLKDIRRDGYKALEWVDYQESDSGCPTGFIGSDGTNMFTRFHLETLIHSEHPVAIVTTVRPEWEYGLSQIKFETAVYEATPDGTILKDKEIFAVTARDKETALTAHQTAVDIVPDGEVEIVKWQDEETEVRLNFDKVFEFPLKYIKKHSNREDFKHFIRILTNVDPEIFKDITGIQV